MEWDAAHMLRLAKDVLAADDALFQVEYSSPEENEADAERVHMLVHDNGLEDLLQTFRTQCSAIWERCTSAQGELQKQRWQYEAALLMIDSAEESIRNCDAYPKASVPENLQVQELCSTLEMTVDSATANAFLFTRLAASALQYSLDSIRAEEKRRCEQFAAYAQKARTVLHNAVLEQKHKTEELNAKAKSESEALLQEMMKNAKDAILIFQDAKMPEKSRQAKPEHSKEGIFGLFRRNWNSQALLDEYDTIFSEIPGGLDGRTVEQIPARLFWGNMVYPFEPPLRSREMRRFLMQEYPYFGSSTGLHMPLLIPVSNLQNFAFVFDQKNPVQTAILANRIILQNLLSFPPGRLRVLRLSSSLETVKTLSLLNDLHDDAEPLTDAVIGGKIWLSTPEILFQLQKMKDYISEVSQNVLRSEPDLYTYHAEHTDSVVPYHLITIMLSKELAHNDTLIRLLQEIVRSGTPCGVFTVIFWNQKELPDDFGKQLFGDMICCISCHSESCTFAENSQIQWEPPMIPSAEVLMGAEAQRTVQRQLRSVIETLRGGIVQAAKGLQPKKDEEWAQILKRELIKSDFPQLVEEMKKSEPPPAPARQMVDIPAGERTEAPKPNLGRSAQTALSAKSSAQGSLSVTEDALVRQIRKIMQEQKKAERKAAAISDRGRDQQENS